MWAEVLERISSGEMPPKDQKNLPTAKESAAVVEWLAARIKEGEAARMVLRGRVSFNRLTRDGNNGPVPSPRSLSHSRNAFASRSFEPILSAAASFHGASLERSKRRVRSGRRRLAGPGL